MQHLVIRIINLIGNETQRVVHIDYFCQISTRQTKYLNASKTILQQYRKTSTVADLGFSGRGGAPTPKVGVLTYYFAQELHEMKEFGLCRGCASLAPPPNSQ